MSQSNHDWDEATDILFRESKQQRYISDRATFSILANIAKRRSLTNGTTATGDGEKAETDQALDVFAYDQTASNHAQFKLHKATLASLLQVIKLQWLMIGLLLIILWRAW